MFGWLLITVPLFKFFRVFGFVFFFFFFFFSLVGSLLNTLYVFGLRPFALYIIRLVYL
jgi:hypothetical protein